jgi:hypothetical protein
MFLTIPEIIEISKSPALLFDQVTEPISYARKTILFRFRILSVPLSSNGELMEMAVGPAHDNLNDIVKAVQCNAGRHHKTPPDLRLYIKQPDFQQIKPFVHGLTSQISCRYEFLCQLQSIDGPEALRTGTGYMRLSDHRAAVQQASLGSGEHSGIKNLMADLFCRYHSYFL